MAQEPAVAIKCTNLIDDDRNTELHSAAARGHIDDVLGCLESGEKIDAVNEYGWTPLMMATRNGHLDTVKLLLAWRANATRKNAFGGSVFLMAVACGDLDVLHIILEHLLCGGVSKQSMECASLSPLSVAITFDHEHVFKYLLGKSFNPNVADATTGLTPLMYAAAISGGNETYTKSLLSAGANPTLINKSGLTCADISRLHVTQQPPTTTAPAAPPLIYINQQQHHPMPQSQFMFRPMFPGNSPSNYAMNISPNALSPAGYPQFYPQFFFPAEFSPSIATSPAAQMLCPFNYSPMANPSYILSPHPNIPSPNIVF